MNILKFFKKRQERKINSNLSKDSQRHVDEMKFGRIVNKYGTRKASELFDEINRGNISLKDIDA